MAVKTHSLTVLLLKQGVESSGLALKDPASLAEYSIGEIGTLYSKANVPHPPAWVSLFNGHLGDKLDSLLNSGTAAVFLVSAHNRMFAITFGYGKALLKSDAYEENFGLRVVLNSVNPEKLRSVDAQSLDAVPLSRRSQASVATGIAGFGLNIEQDLIRAATGQPIDVALGKQLTGKDALRVSLPINVEQLPDLLKRLYVQFEADSYKAHFAWIDHLSEVRDKVLIDLLDGAMAGKIQGMDFAKTWLSVPEIIDWSDVEGFRYQKPKRGAVYDDIDWHGYLESLDKDTTVSIEVFKRQHIHCVSQSSGHAIHSWPVYRCIYCELAHNESEYAFCHGKWYRVDGDFLSTLNKTLKNIPKCNLPLPSYTERSEEAYNKDVYESEPDYYALMDRKMIHYGGGQSQIEFCDLYTLDKRMIHVKRYGGSSVLSHLFSQGAVSAQLLLSDADFRQKVNEKLPDTHQLIDPGQKPPASEFEVVYAIASNGAGSELELPLFSKINLRNCYNRLQVFGMNVSLAVIPVIVSDEANI